ncbi:unnamed protein product [Parnassius apollo]|uniref:(apollo) hypothetical protein n=1 Tax=Parnassius apollo TaxID=110799 RepID=A0A8S3WNR9_PARAO|nr:unnamed protein product [Parnassius apollo]
METKLASGLRRMEKWGWGLSKSEVIDIVSEFIKRNKIKTPFINDIPGNDWFLSFRKRHKLSIKKPQPIEYLRKRMTDPFVIHEYFTLLGSTLEKLNLNDPHRIWNLDETSVCLDPTKTKVVGAVGAPCTRTTAGSAKENITVLTTVNAVGIKLNPLIVFKGSYVYDQWMADQNEEYDFEVAYASSKRGWMETEIFYNYMVKVIIPSLGEEKPVLLIYDGHSTHVDERVVALAVENNITILKLPAHTSHLLQPLDLAVFKSFKSIWDKKLVEWQRQNVGFKIRKKEFAEMFAQAWSQTTPKVIQNGFMKGGIYPFDPNVIPKEKYDPAAYKRWQNEMIYKGGQRNLAKLKSLNQSCIDVLNKEMKIDRKLQDIIHVSPENRAESVNYAKGAEVITHTYLEKKNVKNQITVEKEPQIQNSESNSHVHIDDHQEPGPSGISKEKCSIKVKNNKPKNVTKNKKEKNSKNTKSKSGMKKGVNKKCLTNNTSTEVLDLYNKQIIPNENSPTQRINIKTEGCLKKGILKQKRKPLKRQAKNLQRSLSTTSESCEMSSHSDSDLQGILSDNSKFVMSDWSDIDDENQRRNTDLDSIKDIRH